MKKVAKKPATGQPFPGRQPTQNRIIDMLDEIGNYKGYWSIPRSKSKKNPRSQELKGEFRPDLVMNPSIRSSGVAKVVEVESTVTNNTISKSIFSLLDHIARNPGTKGYLIVPAGGVRFASDRVRAMTETVRLFQSSGKGRKRGVSISVLSFDQVRRHHEVLSNYVRNPRAGQPPKFKGFDE